MKNESALSPLAARLLGMLRQRTAQFPASQGWPVGPTYIDSGAYGELVTAGLVEEVEHLGAHSVMARVVAP